MRTAYGPLRAAASFSLWVVICQAHSLDSSNLTADLNKIDTQRHAHVREQTGYTDCQPSLSSS